MSRFSRSIMAAASAVGLALTTLFIPVGSASAQPVGSPLIEYTRFGGGNWGSFNMSGSWGLPPALINAVPCTDPVTSYQNEYAVATNGHLIEYTRLLTGQWVAADITTLANGPLVTNTPMPYIDPANGAQAVAVTTTAGHLAIFSREPIGGWKAFDVSQSYSLPGIVNDPAPFLDPVTGLLNVYGTAGNGHLIEFTRMATVWTAADLTGAFVGPTIINDPRPFVDPLTHWQNVYATTTSGDIVEYTRPVGPGYIGQWITVDLTAAYGGPKLQDSPAPFTDPLTDLQNAYVTTAGDHLVEYTRVPNGTWILVDLTAAYGGAPVSSTPAPYVDPNSDTQPLVSFQGSRNCGQAAGPSGPVSGSQVAFVTTSGSHLSEYQRQPAGNWRIIDLTGAYNAAPVTGDPQPFMDPATGFLNVYLTGIP